MGNINRLDSDEDEIKKSFKRYFDKLIREREVLLGQLERLNKKPPEYFTEFTEKVIKKYDSSEYVNRWYSRGIEPPENLFWFLFEYAKKYGRECTEEEWELHGGMFTSELWFVNGYYFARLDGQGSAIIIKKKI